MDIVDRSALVLKIELNHTHCGAVNWDPVTWQPQVSDVAGVDIDRIL